MAKRIIRLTENDLHRIIAESVDSILTEGFFDKFKKTSEPEVEPEIENEMPKDHIYSAKELQYLYDNQNDLNDIERKVLGAAMWLRAMLAGYHGYTKEWHNIALRGGETYYYYKGELRKTP